MRKDSRWRASLLIFAVAALSVACGVSQGSINVTLIADFHYDPLYGNTGAYGRCNSTTYSPLGTPGCDAPMTLIESALLDASSLKNAFTVFAGDWQRHNFDTTGLSTSDVFGPVSEKFAAVQTSGGVPSDGGLVNVAVTLGNNDFEEDYEFNYTAPSQPYLLAQIESMTSHNVLSAAEGEVMRSCGFYRRETASLDVVTLNAFLWTYSTIPPISSSVEDPCGQFVFLSDALARATANGKKVIIVTHVPPSVNAYGVVRKGVFNSTKSNMYWQPEYQLQFNALLQKYQSTVVLHVYGHTHVFSVLAYEETAVPGFVIPSISPIFGNTPSYLVATFSDAWELESVYQRYLGEDGSWRVGQRVEEALGMTSSYRDVPALRASLKGMLTNNITFMKFLLLHGGGVDPYYALPNNTCDAFCRGVTVCNTLYGYFSDISACTYNYVYPNGESERVKAGDIIATVLLLVIVAAVCAGYGVYVVFFKRKEEVREAQREEQVVRQQTYDVARLSTQALQNAMDDGSDPEHSPRGTV